MGWTMLLSPSQLLCQGVRLDLFPASSLLFPNSQLVQAMSSPDSLLANCTTRPWQSNSSQLKMFSRRGSQLRKSGFTLGMTRGSLAAKWSREEQSALWLTCSMVTKSHLTYRGNSWSRRKMTSGTVDSNKVIDDVSEDGQRAKMPKCLARIKSKDFTLKTHCQGNSLAGFLGTGRQINKTRCVRQQAIKVSRFYEHLTIGVPERLQWSYLRVKFTTNYIVDIPSYNFFSQSLMSQRSSWN